MSSSVIPYQGFVGGTYLGTQPKFASEICMNLIPNVAPQTAKTKKPIAFSHTPGCKPLTTVGSGPVRAALFQDDRLFVVSNDSLYSVSSTWVPTLLGVVGFSTLPARMSINGTAGNQLMVVSGNKGYIYNFLTGVFSQIVDVDFTTTPQDVAFLDSYFMTFSFNSRTFQFSAPEDGTSWSSGDLAEKEKTTDNLRALGVLNSLLWLFGSKTIEVWYNTGDANVTFAPIDGGIIQCGLGPLNSLVEVLGAWHWLAQDDNGTRFAVRMADYNGNPERISQPEIESLWSAYARFDDAIGYTYAQAGHTFYVLNFPTDKKTWVYDVDLHLWHERGYLNPATGDLEAHLGRCHALAFDKHIVGSRIDGQIYELSLTYYYDDISKPIRRVRQAPHVATDQRDITINNFMLDCATGVANATGQGSDPQVMMRYSIDGGMTFSEELFAGQGAVGNYEQQLQWARLGQGRDWVFQLATSEPIPHMWAGASLDAEGDR